jgi:hypothetical protein
MTFLTTVTGTTGKMELVYRIQLLRPWITQDSVGKTAVEEIFENFFSNHDSGSIVSEPI